MKTNYYKIKQGMLLLIFIGLINVSCGEDISQDCDGDNAQPIDTFYESDFEELNCQFQNLELNGKETQLIIKNQDEYENYFDCIEELPAIDFDEYFILAGVYSHHQCAILHSKSVVICDNRLIYRVRILEQICAALTSVPYFTVLNKTYVNMDIKFDVQFTK